MKTLLRTFWIGLALGLLSACGTTTVVVPDEDTDVLGEAVPGQYIVTLRGAYATTLSDAAFDASVLTVSADHRGTPNRPLRLINGFVATDLDGADAAVLRHDPRIASVEPDRFIHVREVRSGVSWNLDRMDQRPRALDGLFQFGTTGAGVSVYIVDTGIRSTHVEFGNRVQAGFTLFKDQYGSEDCNSHGTHVAGTAAGATVGVAPGAKLVPVRVMDCNGTGTISGVISGLDWIANTHRGPAVANLSLGGGISKSLDSAVQNLVARGVVVTVAAGNSNTDACGVSPARVPEALTVGAIYNFDTRSPYSNYGSCVDLFAPGSGIPSAWSSDDTRIGTKSGTSMAAPHVAGLAALWLESMPKAKPDAIAAAILASATSGALSDVGAGSPNLLTYADPTMAADASGPADPAPEPEPTPEPTEPVAPCASCEVVTGIASVDQPVVWPPDGYVAADRSGLHLGWLRGPAGSDVDLELQRLNGRNWSTVATSTSTSSTEELTYVGKAGTYRWLVVTKAGEGNFTLYASLP